MRKAATDRAGPALDAAVRAMLSVHLNPNSSRHNHKLRPTEHVHAGSGAGAAAGSCSLPACIPARSIMVTASAAKPRAVNDVISVRSIQARLPNAAVVAGTSSVQI